MLVAAIALCFLGMFIMFYSILRGQDRVMRFVNKKHKEFIDQLTNIEETISAMAQLSSRSRPQKSVAETFSAQQQQPPTQKNIQDSVVSRTVENNDNSVNLEDVFPSDISSKNTRSDSVLLEEVFTLQPDMAIDGNMNAQTGRNATESKSSMLELLQL